jgi:hypothetical protein
MTIAILRPTQKWHKNIQSSIPVHNLMGRSQAEKG